MRFFAVLFVLGFSVGQARAASSECVQEIVRANDGSPATAGQLECVEKDAEALKALVTLCSEDKKQLSATFKTYRNYELMSQMVTRQLVSSTGAARGQAQARLTSISRDWFLFGSRREVTAALDALSVARSRCAH